MVAMPSRIVAPVILVAFWFAGESTSAQTKGLIGTLRGEQAAPEIDELEGTWNVVESAREAECCNKRPFPSSRSWRAGFT
jgi:hypothetical protein